MGVSARGRRRATDDPLWAKVLIIGVVLAFLALVLILPLAAVFTEALRKGLDAAIAAVNNADALAAVKLTLITAAIAVPFNAVFGLCAAWAIAKHDFPGKSAADHPDRPAVLGLAGGGGPDLRAGVRPAGLVRRLWLVDNDIKVDLRRARHRAGHHLRDLPLRRPRTDPADAGAGGFGGGGRRLAGRLGPDVTFWRVTAPNVRWGLLYGVLLCNARAMGEFGAVSVVSGHIRGLTNTMPLHVEILYNEYDFTGAFAVAALLCLLADRHPGAEDRARSAQPALAGAAVTDRIFDPP
jgi:sulfate transport system permease protein